MLYDGAKYFYRAYKYKETLINDINPYIFENPYPTLLPKELESLYDFIEDYLNIIENKEIKEKNSQELVERSSKSLGF